MAPSVVARAYAIVNTAMYDAWSAYTPLSNGTQLGGSIRQPSTEWTDANKSEAISFAAYRAAIDLWPDQSVQFAA